MLSKASVCQRSDFGVPDRPSDCDDDRSDAAGDDWLSDTAYRHRWFLVTVDLRADPSPRDWQSGAAAGEWRRPDAAGEWRCPNAADERRPDATGERRPDAAGDLKREATAAAATLCDRRLQPPLQSFASRNHVIMVFSSWSSVARNVCGLRQTASDII